ncbi:MAG: FHA domain-containing protein [Planctomycetota bacterium]
MAKAGEGKMHYLAVRDSRGEKRFCSLPEDGAVIGRSPSCTVTLSDDSVSREHAGIKPEGDRWYVEDLDSHNGILVNGKKTTRSQIQHGDVIHLPNYRIEFYAADVSQDAGLDVCDGQEVSHPHRWAGWQMNVPPTLIVATGLSLLAAVHWFSGIAAFIVGFFALGQITAGREYTGTRLAAVVLMGALVLSGARIAVNAGIVEQALVKDPMEERCQDNMLAVWDAVEQYRREYGGAYPDTLKELYPRYVDDRSILYCPGSTEQKPGDGYLYAGKRAGDREAGEVLLIDDGSQNHALPGACVLYTDGTLEVLSEEDYQMLTTQLEWLE